MNVEEVILAQSQQAQIARWIWLDFVEILSVVKIQLIIVSRRAYYELIDTNLGLIYGVYFFVVFGRPCGLLRQKFGRPRS